MNARKRSKAGQAISRRLQAPKPKPIAAKLLEEVKQRPEHPGLLACAYGAHDFYDADPIHERCRRCDAYRTKPMAMAMLLAPCERKWVDDVRAGVVHEHLAERDRRRA